MIGGNIASDPSAQIRVAESAADLDTAHLILFRNAADLTHAATEATFSEELLARVDRDRVLTTRHAITSVDRIFATTGARALSLDNPIQRAWRDVHAGAAHPASIPEIPLAAYGALAFGLDPTPPH